MEDAQKSHPFSVRFSEGLGNVYSQSSRAGKAAAQGAKHGSRMFKRNVSNGIKRVQRMKQPDYTWQELNKIEKRRREILSRRNITYFGLLLFWDGTVLAALCRDPFLYCLMALYVAIRIVARNTVPEGLAIVATANISIIGTFLSFFLVLYVDQANKRFMDMYQNSRTCQGGIFDAAALARTTLDRGGALRMIRYLNAAHIAGYIGLTDTYTFDNFFVHANRAKSMLTPGEVNRMRMIEMNYDRSACHELVVWAMAEVTKAQTAGIMDNRMAQCYRDLMFRLRGNFGSLYDYADQPIGFFYVHFACLLSVTYLPLFTIQVALDAGVGDQAYWMYDILSGILVVIQATYVLGLQYIANRLSDPYGDDLEDLSIINYVNETWVLSRRILEADLPKETTTEEEEAFMDTAEQSIGFAWEGNDGDVRNSIPGSGPFAGGTMGGVDSSDSSVGNMGTMKKEGSASSGSKSYHEVEVGLEDELWESAQHETHPKKDSIPIG